MSNKPVVRVKAGKIAFPAVAIARPEPGTRFLRGDRGGVLLQRRAVTRDGKIDVREAAARASALAFDFMHNSGWIAGACDQVIVDTIGTELKLNMRPDLSALGYDEKETSDWCEEVERAWRLYCWQPEECDLAGKATLAEQLDGVMRYWLGGGEGIARISFLSASERRRYGVQTGTKLSLVAPHRLKRETRSFDGLDQGIFHDANGRATHYRFRLESGGIEVDEDVAAYDRAGLRQVLHVFDRGETPDSPRGITPLAAIAKVIAQYDQLADATLATALIQTIFAATIKSPEPTQSAFDAISAIGEMDDYEGYEQLRDDLLDVWGQRIDLLKDGKAFSTSDHGRINHLGPGESFEFHTAGTPGAQYLPFANLLHREIARRLGVTATSLTMDFNGATYSSTRMETATVWPLAVRRRERIPAPVAQGLFEAWLDERIASGRTQIKGGYAAFRRFRAQVCWTEWQGPSKPSADDFKAAVGAEKRLQSGVSTLARECAENGEDWREVARQRQRERDYFLELGLEDPFLKPKGGSGGPLGGAVEGQREPAKEDA